MTPEEHIALHRMKAAWYRVLAAQEDMNVACLTTGNAFMRLAAAIREGERRDIQRHPDLAELDAQLDGFYGAQEEAQ